MSRLMALHRAGIPLDGPAMQGWALGHGWSGGNPRQLAIYADQISRGGRPRHERVVPANYVHTLRTDR